MLRAINISSLEPLRRRNVEHTLIHDTKHLSKSMLLACEPIKGIFHIYHLVIVSIVFCYLDPEVSKVVVVWLSGLLTHNHAIKSSKVVLQNLGYPDCYCNHLLDKPLTISIIAYRLAPGALVTWLIRPSKLAIIVGSKFPSNCGWI